VTKYIQFDILVTILKGKKVTKINKIIICSTREPNEPNERGNS